MQDAAALTFTGKAVGNMEKSTIQSVEDMKTLVLGYSYDRFRIGGLLT